MKKRALFGTMLFSRRFFIITTIINLIRCCLIERIFIFIFFAVVENVYARFYYHGKLMVRSLRLIVRLSRDGEKGKFFELMTFE